NLTATAEPGADGRPDVLSLAELAPVTYHVPPPQALLTALGASATQHLPAGAEGLRAEEGPGGDP
ncbi:hypothetical protein, partial [Streptomyces sp. SP18CS02]|uniref:hypothetical protein n=1 Tax=Streptomyces sp. SP18CS02 TaxID=3002531 RepID=UPI002E79C46F